MEPELEKAIDTGIHPPLTKPEERGLNRTRYAIIDKLESREQKTRGIYGDWCIRLCWIRRNNILECERSDKGELLFEDVVFPLSELKFLKLHSPEIAGYIDLRGEEGGKHPKPYEITKTCPYCKELFTPEDSREKYCCKGHQILYNRRVASNKK